MDMVKKIFGGEAALLKYVGGQVKGCSDGVDYALQMLLAPGKDWYLDPVSGSDTLNTGQSWNSAYKTMAKIISVATDGDVIHFYGTLSEDSLTLAANAVTIVGALPSPVANMWQASSAGTAKDKTLLTITGKGCRLINFKVRPGGVTSGHPIGISLAGAWQTEMFRLLFQGMAGSHYGIYSDGNNANVRIISCVFQYLNTLTDGHAITGGGYTVGENSGWTIEDCIFHSNVNHIVMRMRQGLIKNCEFRHYGLAAAGTELTTTKKIDISGAVKGWNKVTKNSLSGAFSNTGGYYSGINDDWAGNENNQVTDDAYVRGGLTVAPPQAA